MAYATSKPFALLLLVLTLCVGMKLTLAQTAAASILDGHWQLEAVWNGKTWTSLDSSAAYMIYFDDGEQAVSGKICNQFRGKLTSNQAASSLTIGPILGTRMACPTLRLETQVLAHLEAANRYAITGNRLQLLHKQKPLLRLKRAARPAQQLDEGMGRPMKNSPKPKPAKQAQSAATRSQLP
ncbi:MAG: META domain-containing protein [Bacteroidetes bacterium]|nr:MAG: META domain-containing protein [Bacteroidota bacterium]